MSSNPNWTTRAEESKSAWHVLETRPFKERYVSFQLTELGIKVYCPMIKVFKRYRTSGQRQIEPFFPGYVFAWVETSSALFHLRQVRDFKRLLTFGGRPAHVEPSIIEGLRRRENDQGYICIRPRKSLQPNDTVEIIDGPFRGHAGLFLRYQEGKYRVCILLELLQRRAILELPLDSVSPTVTSAPLLRAVVMKTCRHH